MVSKKNLSDMIRQEGQKLPNQEIKAVEPSVSAEIIPPVEEISPEKISDVAPAPHQNNDIQANLEKQVQELQKSLAEAKTQEGNLQQKVTELQADLSVQKKLVQQLQKHLEQFNAGKAELEQAQKAARELADANYNLSQQLVETKKPQPETKPTTYRKSDRAIVKYPPLPPTNDDGFANKIWLLD